MAAPTHYAGDVRLVSGRTRLATGVLAVMVLAAAVPTFLVDGILNGTAVMNGSARGTALVMVVVALPALLAGLLVHGSPVRMWALHVGALAYLTYNAMLFVYATPFNELFFVYAALLGLALWTLVSALVDPRPGLEVGDRLPARGIAAYIFTVAGLNALAWIAFVAPDLGEDPPGFLEGTGLTTNPIYVQDLAVWLPAMVIIGVLLWQRRPVGVQLAGAGLVFWLIEAVGVAVDQLYGHNADPSSDVATIGGSLMFVVLAVVTLVPLVSWWRTADQGRSPTEQEAVELPRRVL